MSLQSEYNFILLICSHTFAERNWSQTHPSSSHICSQVLTFDQRHLRIFLKILTLRNHHMMDMHRPQG